MTTVAPTPDEPAQLRELAVEIAREAGQLLRGFATERAGGGDIDVGSKSSQTDPVSEADRASERLIASRLGVARPDDGLLGEEDQASRESGSGLTWVVDPLDGTVNFLYGIPIWAVSIAVVDSSGPLAGAVYDPSRDEMFHAARGFGARLGDTPLACSAVSDLSQALVATGFAYDAAVRVAQGRLVADLLGRVRDVRRAGSAALDLCWLAAARLDAYVEFGLQSWDWAAGSLVVTEAGGRSSEHRATLGGRSLPGLCAGGPVAHDHLVEWLEATT
ncbi:MAG: inositol monophosphatase family protein [Nitriliruptoraceae bacterium]